MTEVEPEFDVNERDSWAALEEWRDAICPHCGNLTAVCSDPGGLTGVGWHITQTVCWPTAIREATVRRIRIRHGKDQPDMQGMVLTDGVTIGVAAFDDGSEDILGLAEQPQQLLDRAVVADMAERTAQRDQPVDHHEA